MIDSYMTVEEANEIVSNCFTDKDKESVIWNSLSNEEKQVLIQKATIKLETSLLFIGKKVRRGQKLAFPRVYKCNVIECPFAYKLGILTQGLGEAVVAADSSLSLTNNGIKQYTVEGASITFDTSRISKYSMDTNGILYSVRTLLHEYIYG